MLGADGRDNVGSDPVPHKQDFVTVCHARCELRLATYLDAEISTRNWIGWIDGTRATQRKVRVCHTTRQSHPAGSFKF